MAQGSPLLVWCPRDPSRGFKEGLRDMSGKGCSIRGVEPFIGSLLANFPTELSRLVGYLGVFKVVTTPRTT